MTGTMQEEWKKKVMRRRFEYKRCSWPHTVLWTMYNWQMEAWHVAQWCIYIIDLENSIRHQYDIIACFLFLFPICCKIIGDNENYQYILVLKSYLPSQPATDESMWSHFRHEAFLRVLRHKAFAWSFQCHQLDSHSEQGHNSLDKSHSCNLVDNLDPYLFCTIRQNCL